MSTPCSRPQPPHAGGRCRLAEPGYKRGLVSGALFDCLTWWFGAETRQFGFLLDHAVVQGDCGGVFLFVSECLKVFQQNEQSNGRHKLRNADLAQRFSLVRLHKTRGAHGQTSDDLVTEQVAGTGAQRKISRTARTLRKLSFGTFSQGLQACQSQKVSISASFIKRGSMRTTRVLHGGEPGPELRQIQTNSR